MKKFLLSTTVIFLFGAYVVSTALTTEPVLPNSKITGSESVQNPPPAQTPTSASGSGSDSFSQPSVSTNQTNISTSASDAPSTPTFPSQPTPALPNLTPTPHVARKNPAPQPTPAPIATPAPTSIIPIPPAVSPPPPVPNPTPTPVPTPSPVAQNTSGYHDGSYTGSPADAFYGNVQVKAIIQSGKITDVQFLDYPQDRGHSIAVNTYAMPILTSEAIQTQSAQVDTVSGATDTSMAFQQSLSSALSQAKN